MSCQGPHMVAGLFTNLITLRDASSARESSWDRTGGNRDFVRIEPGSTRVLADIEGCGCIRRLYFTVGGPDLPLRSLVLRMYWDGEGEPSVEVPLGDFFGMGHGCIRHFSCLAFSVNPGWHRVIGTQGFVCYLPMPFVTHARMTLTNEWGAPLEALWYHVDYERTPRQGGEFGRFHACFRRECPASVGAGRAVRTVHDEKNLDGAGNYVILEAQGQGNFAGYFLNIDNQSGQWYGEGDDMLFIDGEQWPPSIHGTGTEEIAGGGSCPTVEFCGPFSGFHLIANDDFSGKVSLYRFFIPDPVCFRTSLRATIERGHANNLANDYSSTAFWYQSEPHQRLPELPALESRLPLQNNDVHDRAYRALTELRQKAIAVSQRVERAGGPAPDPKELAAAYARIGRAFQQQDFGLIVELCALAIKLLDAAGPGP